MIAIDDDDDYYWWRWLLSVSRFNNYFLSSSPLEKARIQGEKEAAKYVKSMQVPSTTAAEAASSSFKKAQTPSSSSSGSSGSSKGSSGNIAVK